MMITSINNIIDNCKASQSKDELKELLPILYTKTIGVIVEIGVHRGYSLDLWEAMFEPEILVGIEPDVTSLDSTYFDKYDIIIEDSHSHIAEFSLSKILGRRKIDLLFIDGDHSYEGVKKDYEMYERYVRQGGVIILHDILAEEGVKEYWAELSERLSNFQTITKENGYAIIFK